MARDMALTLGLGKALLLASAAHAISYVDPPLPFEFVDRLAGRYDTRAQYEAAPATLKVLPSVTGQWLDRQYATITRVVAPAIGNTVLYLEWRGGGPDGPISRQRLWAFDLIDNEYRMRFYTFRDPARLAGRSDDPEAFRLLTLADVRGYPTECAARWITRVDRPFARIEPKNCRIVAQSGRGMRLDVTIRMTDSGFSYQEKGILDDGRLAFAVPSGAPYRFDRVTGR